MTDITELAAACANRIFDRMELCRGSAILKEDIAREVESTLREAIKGALFPGVFVDESDGITIDPAYVNEFFAETSRQYHESNALLRHNSRAKHTLAPGHTVSVDPSENRRALSVSDWKEGDIAPPHLYKKLIEDGYVLAASGLILGHRFKD